MKIDLKTNQEILFRELAIGDLFVYTSQFNEKAEVFLRIETIHVDRSSMTHSTVNAINLSRNLLESFGIQTVVKKVNGTLVVD